MLIAVLGSCALCCSCCIPVLLVLLVVAQRNQRCWSLFRSVATEDRSLERNIRRNRVRSAELSPTSVKSDPISRCCGLFGSSQNRVDRMTSSVSVTTAATGRRSQMELGSSVMSAGSDYF